MKSLQGSCVLLTENVAEEFAAELESLSNRRRLAKRLVGRSRDWGSARRLQSEVAPWRPRSTTPLQPLQPRKRRGSPEAAWQPMPMFVHLTKEVADARAQSLGLRAQLEVRRLCTI